MTERRADALVIFGVSGDLAHKKIYRSLYSLEEQGLLAFPVIGVARAGWTVHEFKREVHQVVDQQVRSVNEKVLDALLARLDYVDGDYRDAATFGAVKAALNGAQFPVTYLAIPPSMFESVVQGLSETPAAEGRLVVEKPFGRDLASARALDASVHAVFPEDRVFRIDHFLGKEAIENILVFRFANELFEPFWNRDHIARVIVTMAEDFGVADRGAFYEEVGALRDVIENHLFQLLALLTMNAPTGLDAHALRDEKARIFRAMRPVLPDDLVRGQYRGYRLEKGVAPDSDVETFAALRLWIDDWRWEGVPFYFRAGKRLPHTVTEVLIELKEPPRYLFDCDAGDNWIRYQVNPQTVVAIGARIKDTGRGYDSSVRELKLIDEEVNAMPEYARLLGDAIVGDSTLFTREDAVEMAWAVVDEVLREHAPVEEYEPGTWGPPSAEALFGGPWPEPGDPA
ncbi:MAG: glucose-6-phosphate dehydrogenase [Acidimicrobiia bacterium]